MPDLSHRWRACAVAVAALVFASVMRPARAEEPAGPGGAAQTASSLAESAAEDLTVELNRLEDAGGGCRLTLVVTNPGARRFDSLKLDLVLFGPDGVVARRLAVETGPVRPAKTVVRLFEAADLACAGVGRLLLNDVTACADGAGPIAGCVDRLRTASRATVPFDR